jgi:hypothetical protein
MRLSGDLAIGIVLPLIAFTEESLSGLMGHVNAIPLPGSVVVPDRAEMDATVLVFQREIPSLARFVVATTRGSEVAGESKYPIDLGPLDVRDLADLGMAPEMRGRCNLISFVVHHNATILVEPLSEIKSKMFSHIAVFA